MSGNEGHIIVTRHHALAKYLIEKGIAPASAPVIPHAHPDDVRGKCVYGVLPLRLAVLAECVVEVPLRLTEKDKGYEIGYQRLCEIALPPVMYRVERI